MKPQCALRQGPQAWHPASEDLKAACRKAAARAAERGVDLPTLAIKAAVQEPRIATSLVGFCRAEEVRGNWPACVGRWHGGCRQCPSLGAGAMCGATLTVTGHPPATVKARGRHARSSA